MTCASHLVPYLVLTKVRMHLAHKTFLILRPSSYREIFWRFGRKVRRVAFLDQGRFLPKVVFFPQFSHIAI